MSEPGFEHWRSMLLDPGWSSAGTGGTWLGWETAVGRSGKQQGVQANGGWWFMMWLDGVIAGRSGSLIPESLIPVIDHWASSHPSSGTCVEGAWPPWHPP